MGEGPIKLFSHRKQEKLPCAQIAAIHLEAGPFGLNPLLHPKPVTPQITDTIHTVEKWQRISMQLVHVRELGK